MSPLVRFALIQLAVFLAWRIDFGFFWRDEWMLLREAVRPELGWLLDPHFGHFKPLFKLFYLVEARLFGGLALAFHWVNLLTFGALVFAFDRVAAGLVAGAAPAAFLTLLLALHPTNYEMILWGFQVCEILHVTAVVLALGLSLRLAAGRGSFAALVACLLAAHLTFGNGLFLPSAAAATLWLAPRRDAARPSRLAVLAGMQAAFLVGQVLVGTLSPRAPGVGQVAQALVGYPLRLFGFVANGLSSAVLGFPALLDLGALLVGGFLLAALLLRGLRQPAERPLLLSLAAWLLAGSLAVPLLRPVAASGRSLYYTSLILPQALLLLAVLAQPWLRALLAGATGAGRRPLVLLASAAVLAGSLVADRRFAAEFEARNRRNAAAMDAALAKGDRYRPYYDPVAGGNLLLARDAVHAYRLLLRSGAP